MGRRFTDRGRRHADSPSAERRAPSAERRAPSAERRAPNGEQSRLAALPLTFNTHPEQETADDASVNTARPKSEPNSRTVWCSSVWVGDGTTTGWQRGGLGCSEDPPSAAATLTDGRVLIAGNRDLWLSRSPWPGRGHKS
ncbi:hypothetical protein PYK79_12095 [Streptomyces sp. ID05-04B]|nr:hypothetical protein [Streptomyces sp. ID05-04B]